LIASIALGWKRGSEAPGDLLMLAKVDEVYRGYGIVWTTGKAGRLEALLFPEVPESGDVVGPAVFRAPTATADEGREVLRSRAQAMIDEEVGRTST
jgi:hypothetical protein